MSARVGGRDDHGIEHHRHTRGGRNRRESRQMGASSSQVRRSAIAGASIVTLAVAGLATIFGSGLTTPISAAPAAAEASIVQVIAPPADPVVADPVAVIPVDIRPGDPAPAPAAQPAATPDPGVQYVYVTAPSGEGNEHENEKGDH
jgi:hypothetical protein